MHSEDISGLPFPTSLGFYDGAGLEAKCMCGVCFTT